MKNSNLLIIGILTIIAGIVLLIYSVVSYAETRALSNKIDFDELENNNQISTQDKYYKHLSIADYLNQAIKKNKNLPIKNTSCIYVDYAQRNTILMYKLIFKGVHEDLSKRDVVEGNIKHMQDSLNDYKMCKNASEYKKELDNILDEIKKNNDMQADKRLIMETFLNTPSEIEQSEMLDPTDQMNIPTTVETQSIQNIDKDNTQDIYRNAPVLETNN